MQKIRIQCNIKQGSLKNKYIRTESPQMNGACVVSVTDMKWHILLTLQVGSNKMRRVTQGMFLLRGFLRWI